MSIYPEEAYEAAKIQANNAYTSLSAKIGGTAQVPLHMIHDRINGAFDRVDQIAATLSQHADRVFGERPEVDAKHEGRPVRSGQLGEIEDALDRLDDSIARLLSQANRNCKLA